MYGLMAGVGFLACLFCISKLARMRGLQVEDPIISLLVAVIPVGLGGSILYGITNIPYFQYVFEHWDRYDGLSQQANAILGGFSGIVFYGGLIGALISVCVYCKVAKKPLPLYMDMFVVCAPLFHTFGRIGCFFGGCCFGIECPFGFVPDPSTPGYSAGASLFPVQLLESACDFVIFLVLLRLFRSNGRLKNDAILSTDAIGRQFRRDYGDALVGDDRLFGNGRLIWAYFLMYGCVRFLDEFLRGDAYRGFLGMFSTSQWISLALLAIAVVMLVKWARSRASVIQR